MQIQCNPYLDLPIYFDDLDFKGFNPNHSEALVITLDVTKNEVKQILVDNDSLIDILFYHTLKRMDVGEAELNRTEEKPLYGFGHNTIQVMGTIRLPIIFGKEPCQII